MVSKVVSRVACNVFTEQEKGVCSICQQGTIATFCLMTSVLNRSMGKVKNPQSKILNMYQ